MNHVKVSLFVILLLGFMFVSKPAQDNKPSNQKPAPIAWDDSKEPKDPVDKLLAAATRRGETVLSGCIDNCAEDPAGTAQGDLERGRIIRLPKPSYPALARAAHVSGTVEVKVLIDVDGKVIEAFAVSGPPLLYAVCVQAARDSVFGPSKWKGEPVKVTGIVRYNFISGKQRW